LKKRFGVGYNLVIAKDSKDPSPEIDNFINSRIDNAIKLSEVSSEITYQIPTTESDKFEQFFTELDDSLESLKIKSYGVGVTTLEEVFLKVGTQDESETLDDQQITDDDIKQNEESKDMGPTKGHGSINSVEHISDAHDVDDYSIAEHCEQNVFWLHFHALCVKRFLVSFRQLKTSFLEIFIPILLIILGLALANISFFTDPKAITLNLGDFPTPNKIFISSTQAVADLSEYTSTLDTDLFSIDSIDTVTGANVSATLRSFENVVFNESDGYDVDIKNSGNHVVYNIDKTVGGEACSVFGFSNGFARDAAPTHMQFVLNSCLNVLLPGDVKFRTRLVPYPLSATAKAGAQAGSGSIVAFLFAIALAMIPAGVAAAVTNERETHVKHQQFISGASLVSYWLSNYVIDVFRSLIPIIVAIIFIFIFGTDLPFIWIHLLLYCLCIHPFTYCLSFMFKNENSAQNVTIILNIFLGGFLAIAILILQVFESTRDIANIVRWFPRIIPSYCVVSAIYQISSRNIFARSLGLDNSKSPLSFDVSGADAMFLAINIFLWWAVLILIENGAFNFITRSRADTTEAGRRTEGVKVDSEVQSEELRCLDLQPSECSVLINGLRKVYTVNGKPFAAVRNISLGLQYGECFALLGVNGAGKSTTFKSMTGDVTPTDGKIYIDGLDLSSVEQFSRARKLIGYCPQENAIFEGMTVREHLVFYSRIKGIIADMRTPIIDKIMGEMDLKQFENVRCETLSGGNKRKLSVAMAMIGNPPIVFLDEPSTGMDPRAKRFMWTIISRISTLRKKSTVILTTHSMEEAEALCTKMGIMVNGRFKCYGSSQELKNKFGTGYEIEIKVTWPTPEEANELARKNNMNLEDAVKLVNLQEALQLIGMGHLSQVEQYEQLETDVEKEGTITVSELCRWALLEDSGLAVKDALEQNTPMCMVLEHFNNFYKFRIDKGEKSLGFFFGFMENLKSRINFEEYAVSQTTLEQIFNAFALEQDMGDSEKKKRNSTVRKEKEL
jgi:ATP-binding cassette subfamily A (ABC1) protein 3